jgi:hypothetical protein
MPDERELVHSFDRSATEQVRTSGFTIGPTTGSTGRQKKASPFLLPSYRNWEKP